jgi:thioredoxin reductase (NADPH)
MTEPLRDCTIIGGGVAGCTAAIYAKRYNLDVVVLDTMGGGGGNTALAMTIENYPGFPEGITGIELAQRVLQQAVNLGVEVQTTTAEKITREGELWRVTAQDHSFLTYTVILAMGAFPRSMMVPGEVEMRGKGVSYCATCDGFFYRNQVVAVIGGGNTAVEEALYLANIAKEVHLVHRRDKLRSEKILQDKLFDKAANGNVHLHWNHTLDEVLGDASGVTGVRLKDTTNGAAKELALTGVFIAIGHKPNTDLFQGQLEMRDGYLLIKGGSEGNATATSIEGVFAAGDVADHVYRQAITSAGAGCMAALDVEKFLDDK